jgi:hypothetical protein
LNTVDTPQTPPQDYLTKFLAAWGALLATFGLGWTLYRDLLDRPRLKVTARIRRLVQSSDGRWYSIAPNLPVAGANAELFVVMDVINVGRRPIQWTGWGGKHYRPVGGKDSFVIVAVALPKMLEEGESHSEFTGEINPVIENVKRLFIWDAAGKNWFVSRRALRKLKKDYRKFSA